MLASVYVQAKTTTYFRTQSQVNYPFMNHDTLRVDRMERERERERESEREQREIERERER